MTKENLNNLINILYETTGIHFAVDDSKPFDENEATDEKIMTAVAKLGKKISQATIYEKYLSGDVSSSEAEELLKISHFKAADQCDMFYLAFKQEYDSSVLSVLHGLINTSSWEILKISSKKVVMLHFVKEASEKEDLAEFCFSLYDTLSTEALVSLSVSFDRTSESFSDLPIIYRNLASAIVIGDIFHSKEHVYDYHDLGLGKLIYSLPEEAARAFLEDSLPGVDFDQLDSETINTINTFFDCGLNISETARLLYLHRNTLVYRLDKFGRSTGLDLRNFDDAVSCRVGMMISDYLKNLSLQKK